MSLVPHSTFQQNEQLFISSFSYLQQPVYDFLRQATHETEEISCIDSLATCEGSFFYGGCVYVVSLLLVPFTIALDMIQGVSLGVLELCQGQDGDVIFDHMVDRIIIAPLQQLIFTVISAVCLTVFWDSWSFVYLLGMYGVSYLPEGWNLEKVNLFQNETMTIRNEDVLQKTNSLKQDLQSLANQSIENCDQTEYFQLRERIAQCQSALDIFEGEKDESKIKVVYKKWALVAHPDKNERWKEDATLLFHCLQTAYELLVNLDEQEDSITERIHKTVQAIFSDGGVDQTEGFDMPTEGDEEDFWIPSSEEGEGGAYFVFQEDMSKIRI